MKVGIIDYGIGNVASVKSAFNFFTDGVELIDNPENLKKADLLVMAGVGNYSTAAGKLQRSGFWDALNEEVIGKEKPILGICLGMQLFANMGFEDGETEGLGWIPGKVVKFENIDERVPHMGWNDIVPSDEGLFRNMRSSSFYFMHSYHFEADDNSNIVATTEYGSRNFVSAVRKNNIVGVQFHPEKSQGDGLRFIGNLLEVVK